jgi:UDPglucose--hexose-1-phosphate uridylyltransferase
MELRKDPITQNWVIQEEGQAAWPGFGACPLCPGQEALSPQTIYLHVNGNGSWQVRVTPHPRPLYRIEGDAQRRADGIYDKMRSLGAHEVVVESPDHHLPLSRQSDENVAQVLRAFVVRTLDLKKDRRFRYVTVFRNQGALAGQDLEHPHSQITATPFIPRRVVYELRSFLRYYELKERCLLCDIVKQELDEQVRTVEWDDQFLAFCPFASRQPYETWILPINHNCAFEEDLATWDRQVHFARFLRSMLRRVEAVAPAYQLVLHTAPNLHAKYDRSGHWRTLVDDSHWHFEILPVMERKSKSYGVKEVFYNSLPPERAAQELRQVDNAARVATVEPSTSA